MNKNKLLLVTGNSFTANTLENQLKEFLPEEITIVNYYVDEDSEPLIGQHFAIFSSQEVYEEFTELEKKVYFDGYIIASRTVFHENLDIILSLPRDEKILMVNDSQKSAIETVNHLKSLGFGYLKFIPFYQGCAIETKGINIAITPGEMSKVPSGIPSVYNIGARVMDFQTVVRIMKHYGILEEKVQAYSDLYINSLMEFARRISNVANEASKLVGTVRTELIGCGYYAKYHFNDIIGESSSIRKAKLIANKIAMTDLSVLIEGENGTGKELFASAVHNASKRWRQPFVAINLSALPDQLIESELFGYEDGAFTGAKKGGKIGLFQQANGGTIFLDEIGDISFKIQAKLLRVIQEREIMKVGGDSILPIDVRIIAATNRNLTKMMAEGTFRKDLYYRLKEGYIYLPPLQKRKEDIALLINHWIDAEFDNCKEISPKVLAYLNNEKWPGNVRELHNAIKFSVAVSEGKYIDISDLPYSNCQSDEEIYIEQGLGNQERAVLEAICTLKGRGEITSRTKIHKYLNEQKMDISEYRIRKIIPFLQQNKYVLSKENGYGMELTSLGKEIADESK